MDRMSHDEIMERITATSIEDIQTILDHFGCCIVPEVLSHEECAAVFNEMIWSFERRTEPLEKPFVFQDPTTWETLELFAPHHNMLYKNWGLGQDQYVHDLVRAHPSVIDCFEAVWDTRELICSFDAINLHLPGELCGKDYFFKKHWYHFDQSYLRTNAECYQGLINMFDTEEGDASLCIFLRSHLYFPQYANRKVEEFIARTGKSTDKDLKKEFGGDFNKIDDLDYFTSRGCREVRITCPRGSMVLWDSRMLHDGSQPIRGRPKPNIRSVIYVCMLPTHRISEFSGTKKTFIKKSLEMVAGGRTSNHWPQRRLMENKQPSTRFGGKTEDPGFWYPEPTVLSGDAWKLATGVYSDQDYDLLP